MVVLIKLLRISCVNIGATYLEVRVSSKTNLLSHLDYALKNTDWYAGRKQGNQEMIEAFKPYDLSIRNAQKELSNLSIYERVYQNLKSNAKSVYPTDLDYREEIGSGYDDLFSAIDTELLRIPRFLQRKA